TIERIDFRERVKALRADVVQLLYKECTPHVLIVTDSLSYDPAQGFALTQFVNTLKASTIHGMTPKVTTASRGNDATANLPSYSFTNPTNGLIKSRYDVVFLFGVASEGVNPLPAAEVEAIAKFMEAG